jgi:hypothetical protein
MSIKYAAKLISRDDQTYSSPKLKKQTNIAVPFLFQVVSIQAKKASKPCSRIEAREGEGKERKTKTGVRRGHLLGRGKDGTGNGSTAEFWIRAERSKITTRLEPERKIKPPPYSQNLRTRNSSKEGLWHLERRLRSRRT